MRLGLRLFLYALPFAIPFGTWQLAVIADDYLHCSARLAKLGCRAS